MSSIFLFWVYFIKNEIQAASGIIDKIEEAEKAITAIDRFSKIIWPILTKDHQVFFTILIFVFILFAIRYPLRMWEAIKYMFNYIIDAVVHPIQRSQYQKIIKELESNIIEKEDTITGLREQIRRLDEKIDDFQKRSKEIMMILINNKLPPKAKKELIDVINR